MNYNFNTDRLSVSHCLYNDSDYQLVQGVIKILTPNVTKALPNGWQNLTSPSRVEKWIKERNEESIFLIVTSRASSEMIGFIFLYPNYLKNGLVDLRFGYLLAESTWSKGLGTELVNGLVNYCKELGNVKSLSGGVEKENIASIKVMEKCGFHSSSQDDSNQEVIFYQKHVLNENS